MKLSQHAHKIVLLTGALVALAGTVHAGDEDYLSSSEVEAIKKEIGSKKQSVKDLIPTGFELIQKADGDLDGDGVSDVAIIIRKKAADPQAVLLWKGDASKTYTLWKVGSTHVLPSAQNFMENGGISLINIKKGVLTIGTDISMSMGGWSAGGCTMKWRNEKEGFRLIGVDQVEMDRRCACGTSKGYNLVTGLKIFTSDKNDDGEQVKEKTTQKKGSPESIFWEAFDYEKQCHS